MLTPAQKKVLPGAIIMGLIIAVSGFTYSELRSRRISIDGAPSPTPPTSVPSDPGPGASKNVEIHITSPMPNTVLISPSTIQGEAKGTWFFEATFPISLIDENGRTIASTHAVALSDWMTTSSVPFSATLNFAASPDVRHGFVVFKKDNPSGLPENAGEFRLPATF